MTYIITCPVTSHIGSFNSSSSNCFIGADVVRHCIYVPRVTQNVTNNKLRQMSYTTQQRLNVLYIHISRMTDGDSSSSFIK